MSIEGVITDIKKDETVFCTGMEHDEPLQQTTRLSAKELAPSWRWLC